MIRRRPIPRLLLLGLFGAVALAGCQSYEPMPLDTEAHLDSWDKRKVDDKSVVEYAAELAKRDTVDRGKYDPSDGISLREAEVITLFFNPDLRTARLHADSELAGARESGRWENPEFSVDAMWILDSISKPWILGAGISFTIPFSGRHAVSEELAWTHYDSALRRVVVEEWDKLIELRLSWHELASSIERARLIEAYMDDVRAVQAIADRLVEAGELTSLDARVFALELATQQIELRAARSETRQLELKCRELMGLRPDAPLKLVAKLEPGDKLAPNREQRLIENNPQLELRRSEYSSAEQQLRLEIHKQYPDLTIGPNYEIEEGQSRIGIGFGLPIPIINLNQEGIARARASRLAVRAEFEGELERLLHHLAQAEARLQSARALRDYVETDVAPLVDEQIADARRIADLGEFDALVQLDALSRRHETRVRVLEAILTEANAHEEVRALLGPTFRAEQKESRDD